MWLFNSNAILKTYFKNLFRETVKNGDFTILNKPLEQRRVQNTSRKNRKDKNNITQRPKNFPRKN